MEPDLPIIDPALALECAGGSADLAHELYRMLQAELPRYQQEILTCHQNGDHATLCHHVHKLNGAATYCGVPALKQAAHTFEINLKQQQHSFADDLERLLEQIQQLLEIPTLSL